MRSGRPGGAKPVSFYARRRGSDQRRLCDTFYRDCLERGLLPEEPRLTLIVVSISLHTGGEGGLVHTDFPGDCFTLPPLWWFVRREQGS